MGEDQTHPVFPQFGEPLGEHQRGEILELIQVDMEVPAILFSLSCVA